MALKYALNRQGKQAFLVWWRETCDLCADCGNKAFRGASGTALCDERKADPLVDEGHLVLPRVDVSDGVIDAPSKWPQNFIEHQIIRCLMAYNFCAGTNEVRMLSHLIDKGNPSPEVAAPVPLLAM